MLCRIQHSKQEIITYNSERKACTFSHVFLYYYYYFSENLISYPVNHRQLWLHMRIWKLYKLNIISSFIDNHWDWIIQNASNLKSKLESGFDTASTSTVLTDYYTSLLKELVSLPCIFLCWHSVISFVIKLCGSCLKWKVILSKHDSHTVLFSKIYWMGFTTINIMASWIFISWGTGSYICLHSAADYEMNH